jgi:predicted NodU family carbamoyl transferase
MRHEFYKNTRFPIIINTSMNVMGKIIVNTSKQTYQIILKTNMDYIIIGNNLVKK